MSNNTVDRRAALLEILNEKGQLRVDEVSKLFDVTEVTVRNDLRKLEQEGFLRRTHGGALKSDKVAFDLALIEKEKKHADEKKRIGVAAAKLVYDGETVIIDSGTTTMEVARNLKDKRDITVITNALNIAMELAGRPGIDVILTGGNLRKKSFSLVGPHAKQTLSEHFGDKLFLGVDGFSTIYGITTPNLLEARINRLMVERANEVIVVTDSSKFDKRSLSLIVTVDKINKVITDSNIPDKDFADLKAMGIEVILV